MVLYESGGGMSILFGAPMDHGPLSVQTGFDELGRPIYRTPLGSIVGEAIPEPPRQNALASILRTEVDPFTGRAVHYRDDLQPTRTGNALAALLQGVTQGLTAPGRAARGQPVTLGDVWSTALDAGALAAPMPAPRGAIRAGSMATEGPADEIARMLREGRASEITDDMMARLTPEDNVRLFRLYEEGATGQPMPMDEASRIARAREMGFDQDAYHATRSPEGFSVFRPGVRGSIYMAATPEGAARGALAQAAETQIAGQSVTGVLPLRVRGADIEGLGVDQALWESLPDVVDGDDALKALQPQIERTGATYWDDVYLSVPKGDGFRYYRNDPPAVSYSELEPGRDVFGYRLPSWNSGSDLPSLAARAQRGRSGFLVSDEAGSSIVAGSNTPIRSRFARFDPRLSHLAPLSAGGAGVAVLGGQDDQGGWDRARQYLREIGALE